MTFRVYFAMSNIRFLRSSAMLAAVLLPVLLNSCADLTGISYTDSIQAVTLSGSNRSRTVTVLAKAETWRNSGVIVQPGANYEITATGRWRAGGEGNPIGQVWASPDGTVPPIRWFTARIVPGVDYMTLIGKVSENGTPFGVGSRYNLNGSSHGTLFFRCNDTPGLCGDNEGQVTVTTRFIHGGASNDSSPRVIYRDRTVEKKPDWR